MFKIRLNVGFDSGELNFSVNRHFSVEQSNQNWIFLELSQIIVNLTQMTKPICTERKRTSPPRAKRADIFLNFFFVIFLPLFLLSSETHEKQAITLATMSSSPFVYLPGVSLTNAIDVCTA
jgi:hypothetical protein